MNSNCNANFNFQSMISEIDCTDHTSVNGDLHVLRIYSFYLNYYLQNTCAHHIEQSKNKIYFNALYLPARVSVENNSRKVHKQAHINEA